MITINELIQQGDVFTAEILYVPAPDGVWRTYSVYKIDKKEEYENWKATAKRFIGVNYPNDKSISEFETICSQKLSPETHNKMLAILKALAIIPQPNISQNDNDKSSNINITNNINQNLKINNEINLIFIESIKDELTGKQLKEIKEIIDNNKDTPEKAKTTIIEKLKSFGENVLSIYLLTLLQVQLFTIIF